MRLETLQEERSVQQKEKKNTKTKITKRVRIVIR